MGLYIEGRVGVGGLIPPSLGCLTGLVCEFLGCGEGVSCTPSASVAMHACWAIALPRYPLTLYYIHILLRFGGIGGW